jgi:H/ACA ribonucleoprotein complex subunit 4
MKIDIEKIKESKSTKELLEFSIINIDKPSGPTSFQVSEFVKKRLNATKTSHLGTLDPKVTGVLPVSINRACKLAGYFLGEDKTYVGVMRMHKEIDLEKIQEVIDKKFIGEITQMPPVKSAVKRELRKRTVYDFKVLEKDNLDILFTAKVEGGTYIRTLCVDLGKELEVEAHMLELRRIQAGPFEEHNKNYPIVSMYEFEKALEEYNSGNDLELRKMLIPGEIIIERFPSIEIKEEIKDRILHGSPIHNDEVTKKEYLDYEEGQKLIAFSKNQFIGIFIVSREKNEFAKPDFVMQPI